MLLVAAQHISADCSLTTNDFSQIINVLAVRNYPAAFSVVGGCDPTNVTGLAFKYGDCTLTLSTVLANEGLIGASTCKDYLVARLYAGTPGDWSTSQTLAQLNERADNICGNTGGSPFATIFGTSFGSRFGPALNKYFCYNGDVVGCPEANGLIFALFPVCHSLLLSGKSEAYINTYFESGGDKACMKRRNICADPNFSGAWRTCPITVRQVFAVVSQDNAYRCDNSFPLHEVRCNNTFEYQQAFYCPPQTFWEKYIYAVAVPAVVLPFVMAALFLAFRHFRAQKQHITSDEIVQQALNYNPGERGNSMGSSDPHSSFSSMNKMSVHPELQHVLATKSKFRGVRYDANTRQWAVEGTQRMYANEQEAAKWAYYQAALQAQPQLYQQNLSIRRELAPPPGMFLPSSPGAGYQQPKSQELYAEDNFWANETEMQKQARHIQQLIAFYTYWDPEKPNIEDHVRTLFDRHDFKHILRAVNTKFGLVPPGWSEEEASNNTTSRDYEV